MISETVRSILFFGILLLFGMSFACKHNKLIIAGSAKYNNWIGGQRGVEGSQFYFKYVNRSKENVKLDSIKVDGNKLENWEVVNNMNDTIQVVAYLYTDRKDVNVLFMNGEAQRQLETEKIIKNFNKAYLYFSTEGKEVITILYSNIEQKETQFYK